MKIRCATHEDISTLVAMRMALLIEEGVSPSQEISTELHEYFKRELNTSIFSVVAELDEEIVATSAVIIQQYPPSFSLPSGRRAYLANVYTMPHVRRQGISTKLLDEIVHFLKARDIQSLWLWSASGGIEFYKRYGFKPFESFETMTFKVI